MIVITAHISQHSGENKTHAVILGKKLPITFMEQRLIMRPSSLLFLAPLFLFACSTPAPVVQEVVQQKPVEIKKQDFSTILEENFRGQFTFGEGKGYFKACTTDKQFEVEVSNSIANIYRKIATTPHTPVYIEFTGEITFAESTSHKAGAVMRIDKVHHMALAKASLQCAKPIDNFLFKASGDSPYWRINIDNGQLLFSTKASNEAYVVNKSNFRTTQTSRIHTISKRGEKLELSIQPGHCYDPKNQQYWGYTTTVTSLWGKYYGCGEPGWPSIDLPATGYYQDSNNKLSLNPDYTAEFISTVNNKKTVKSGFWKANTPHHVILMLTKQGRKNIRQEIIFERSGNLLHATQINDKNIVRTISGGVLNLNIMSTQQEIVEVVEPEVLTIKRQFVAQDIAPTGQLDANIQKAVNDYFKIHRTDPKNTRFSAVKYDLNDDGIEDAIVLLDWCSDSSGCEMLIFEGRSKGNYRFSSRVSRVHAPLQVAKDQYYNWQSLLVKKGAAWAELKYDGISYPIQTRNLEASNTQQAHTGIVLFSAGKPTQWFPVKM